MYGPKMETDWFRTQSYLNGGLKEINEVESSTFNSWLNILLIQKRLHELNLPFVMYNCVYSSLDNETDLRELREIKQQINDINYFQPKHGIKDLVSTNDEFRIASDDSHPNHLCYKEWCKILINYIKKEKII